MWRDLEAGVLSRLLVGVLIASALFAPPPAFAADPLPTPSATNGCGRDTNIYLPPIAGSHVLVNIPMTPAVPSGHRNVGGEVSYYYASHFRCPSSEHLAQQMGWISGASASSWG